MTSVEKLKYQVKFLASSSNCMSSIQNAVGEFFRDLKYDKFDRQLEIGEVRTSPNEFNCNKLQEVAVIVTCLGIKISSDLRTFVKHVCKMWCQAALNDVCLQWLVPERNHEDSPGFTTISSLKPTEIAFGTLPTMKDYVQAYRFRQFHLPTSMRPLSSIQCNFNHLQKEITLYVSYVHKHECHLSGEVGQKLTFGYDSVIRIVANMDFDSDAMEVFFHLEYPPLMFVNVPGGEEDSKWDARQKVTKVKEMEYSAKKFERTFEMGCSCNHTHCSSQTIGRNLVLKLITDDKFQFRSNLEQLSFRCAKRTEICFTHVRTHILKQQNKVKARHFPHHVFGRSPLAEAKKFSCDYAWSVVHSRSNVILNQMTLKNMETSSSYMRSLLQMIQSFVKSNLKAFVKSLYCIADMIDKGFVFDFVHVLEEKFLYFCDFVEQNVLPPGMVYIRRVLITPSRLIFLRPYEHFDNRIVRKFGDEFMMRASVQDDDFSKLTFAVQYNSRKEAIMQNFVGGILLNGITVGSRKYEPLASSTSQLREHGMWLYAKDGNSNTASSIRQWMGDFSRIKNVAKFMARMGQCLSTTETGAQILVRDEDEQNEPDIPTGDGKYIFSDGIGMISSALAEEVREFIFRNSSDQPPEGRPAYRPVAFQIRYKGCKGVVVEWPHVPGRKLLVRPSMRKFECTSSSQLEIVKTSAPTKLFLNKHLITILEQMGVPKEAFLKLELSMILDMLDSLVDEGAASSLLAQNLTLFPIAALWESGMAITGDPFFRSLLLVYFRSFAEKLKANMRIAIPDQSGRNMLGVLDETKTLKYGQVFVQYSRSLADPSAGLEILKGPVLVTKNPSLHPGDVRKLVAVDVPELHHIKDCVVFPAQGRRPHPDEMAGSDLDGDEMVVLWYEPLIFPGKSAKPMEYPVYDEECMDREIKLEDMVKFFCQYIQNDSIGTFAHAHLVWADLLQDGIFSKKCMEIARRYPYVLDFAKHGTTEYLKKSERPSHYPDFLQKGLRGNTYHSRKVLGLLYRTSRVLNACSSRIGSVLQCCETHCSSSHDPGLQYPGWEVYQNSAEARCHGYATRVSILLDRHHLDSEAEAFTGAITAAGFHDRWRRQEKHSTLKVVRRCLGSIVGQYRNLFLEDVQEEAKKDGNLGKEERSRKMYQRASAWYMVAFRQKKTPRVLSFPWVIGDILSRLKKERATRTFSFVPSCSFFSEMDHSIEHWCSEATTGMEQDVGCRCSRLVEKITLAWISNSGLNFGSSGDCCRSCYDRIFAFYKSRLDISSCCRCQSYGKSCACSTLSCSPSKLLADFLRFFIANGKASLGTCCRSGCSGFLPRNLQELALQTYSHIVITRSLSCLGVPVIDANGSTDPSGAPRAPFEEEEEGDPIRIPVDKVLEDLINGGHMDDIATYLKRTSGVRDITLTPEVNPMCLMVNSIGKNWQRWNLQEILLDTNFVQNLKRDLNM